MEAFKPDVPGKVGKGVMRIIKNGETTQYDSITDIVDNKRKIDELLCGILCGSDVRQRVHGSHL